MLIDTHCHLSHPQLLSNLNHLFQDCEELGITGFIVPSAQVSDWETVCHIVQQHHAILRAAIGVHPWYASEWNSDSQSKLHQLLQRDSRLWIGEIGLDFVYADFQENQKNNQIQTFTDQIILAQQHQRPIILHQVKTSQMMLNIIKSQKFAYGGIVHSFAGSLEEARLWAAQGFKISIGSLLLNPNAKKVRNVALSLPLEHIVLETDSPFMPKNAPSSPKNLIQIAQIICEMRQITLPDLAAQLEKNLEVLMG